MSVRVALAGAGRWGENLLRVLEASPRARLVAVADPSPVRRARAAALVGEAVIVPALADALSLGVDAVVLATPADTHAELALMALAAGADVLVEKPLAVSSADAERCVAAARAGARVGMVGHLLRYHPAVARAVELARSGALGELTGFSASRLSTRGEAGTSVLWGLGPHDLSVLRAVDASPIETIVARATDGAASFSMQVRLASGLTAHVELSRASPIKERRICIAGTRAAAWLDDVCAPRRVLLGPPGGARGACFPAAAEVVEVPWSEPLVVEIEHFLACVEARAEPLTPLEDGVAVVRALSRAEASLARAPCPEADAAAPLGALAAVWG